METPKIIRDFSKQESGGERAVLAEELKRRHTDLNERRRLFREAEAHNQKEAAAHEATLEAVRNDLADLEQKLSTYNDANFTERIAGFFKMRALHTSILEKRSSAEHAHAELAAARKENVRLRDEAIDLRHETRHMQKLLNDFYARQTKKWKEAEYTQEEIAENFTEEKLIKVSSGDYVALLQRFPGEMVAHVTRQGIRDHLGHIYHTAALDAYQSGFMKMVEDGRLRPPLGVTLAEEAKDEAVLEYFKLRNCDTKTKALNLLDQMTAPGKEPGAPGSYADRMAVHFATEEVADCYYGSEKGNEIFFAFSSALIASQYKFNGQLTESGGGYWNDAWVWANEEKGLDLRTGLIFIPKNARVDRRTGSRYLLDDEDRPQLNHENIDAIRKLMDWEGFEKFAREVIETTGKMSEYSRQFEEDKLRPFQDILKREFGIAEHRLQEAILNYGAMGALQGQKENERTGAHDPINSFDSRAQGILREQGILYREAVDSVLSEEFWKSYLERIGRNDLKVVFYEESGPTEALYAWRHRNGIERKARGTGNLGFKENYINRSEEPAVRGMDRFRALALEVIEKHYPDEPLPQQSDALEMVFP